MADRLYVEKSINDKLIPKIDSNKFLNLDKSSVERIELFMFALALGINANKKNDISSKIGWILETAIKPQNTSMITAILAQKLIKENEIERISDKDEVYNLAQQYANAGFGILENLLEDFSKDKEEEIIWDMISKLDDKYDELFQVIA